MRNKRLLLKAIGGSVLTTAAASTANMGYGASKERETPFPNALLHTHDGRTVRFYDDLIKGKVVIANMMYTMCSGVCPTNTASVLSVQELLGDRVGRDIFIYSLTLQPELDTPAALQEYVKRYGIKAGWTFLTGKRTDIEKIRRSLGFYDSDPVVDADISKHTGVLRIGNDMYGRWFMTPTATPARQIVKSILNVA